MKSLSGLPLAAMPQHGASRRAMPGRLVILTVLLATALTHCAGRPAAAKTLCVDPAAGNDAVRHAQNDGASSCWKTLGRAAWGSVNRDAPDAGEAAQAGDVVLVAPGTYDDGGATGASGTIPLYNPVNQGMEGRPIVFRCRSGTCTLTSRGYRGPVIGSYDRDYITWDGFRIDETATSQMADSGIAIIRDADAVTLTNLTLIGGIGNWGGTNHNGIRIEFSTRCVVSNSDISGVRGDNRTNDTGLTLYVSNRCVIEHNHFHDNQGAQLIEKTGVDHGTLWTYDNVYRFNVFSGGGLGIGISGGGRNSHFVQNIVRDNEQCTMLAPLAPATGVLTDYLFAHNLFSSCGYGIYSGGTNRDGTALFRNNIFYRTTPVYIDEGSSDAAAGYVFSDNVYFGFETFAQLGSSRLSFDDWKSRARQESAAGRGATQDPRFVNPREGDFRLQASSPSRGIGKALAAGGGAGNAAVPAGPYITGDEVVGVDRRPR